MRTKNIELEQRPYLKNNFSRDAGQSSGGARRKDEGVLEARRVRSDKAIAKDWSHPKGLRTFSRPSSLRLGRSMPNTPPSSRLADTRKSLATRPGVIFEMGSNQNKTSLPDFLESYNKSIPVSFPHASIKTLKQFQALHPALFSAKGGSASGGKHGDEWSIDRHRKRVMDWLPSHIEVS